MTCRETRPFGLAGCVLAAVVVLLAAVLAAVPATAHAQVGIAPGTVCSLEVEKCPVEGQGFHLAQVASMDESGRLVAVSALADAVADTGIDPAAFDEATDAQTLTSAASSYAGYVASASGSFGTKDATATGGRASFGGLEPGMYLLAADPATADGSTYVALPNLVIVPRVDGSTYATDCTVDAKFEVRPQQTARNRVTKLWQSDRASERPESVQVAIYDGDELYREVTLDATNNWTFSWDGEGSWFVREKDVPAGYTCSVLMASTSADADEAGLAGLPQASSARAGVDFAITNKGLSYGPKPAPKTGDATSPLLPVALLCAGGVLLLLGIAGRRREKDRA